MIPSVPGQLGDFSRRSKDCCQAQGCTLKDRSSGSSTRPQHSKIVSHLTPPLQTSPGGFSQTQNWVKGRMVVPLQEQVQGTAAMWSPSCQPQKYLCLAKTGCLKCKNSIYLSRWEPGRCSCHSCPSVAHAMPDTD